MLVLSIIVLARFCFKTGLIHFDISRFFFDVAASLFCFASAIVLIGPLEDESSQIINNLMGFLSIQSSFLDC